MNSDQKTTVAVLMGGLSGERKISLKTGKAVVEALEGAGHRAVPYDVTDPALPGLEELKADVAFVALHGRYGEDGTVQRILDAKGIPYTGSGPQASRLGMDKLASKRIFGRCGIPTPAYAAIGPEQDAEDAAPPAERLGYPLVAKPSDSGSSLGIGIVRGPDELPGALVRARLHGETVLLERYVRGREFTVGLLDGEALPMVELVVARQFFDYEAKYADQRTRYVTPVALLPTIYRRACRAALGAYRAIGCRHMARVDMLYGHGGGLYVLEVNTIPGLTARSLLPMAARAAGVEFPALCDRLVRAALRDAAQARRHRRLTA